MPIYSGAHTASMSPPRPHYADLMGMKQSAAFDQLLVAINSVTRRRLDQIVPLVYQAQLSGQIDEMQTDRLATAAQVRRDVFAARHRVAGITKPSFPEPVHQRSRMRGKRRTWGASGALPPNLRSMFTPGENAVAAVIRAEVRRHGACTLPYAAIAKSAGLLSTTVVKRFVRVAKAQGLIAVQERRITGTRNAPNVIRITSVDWQRWNEVSERTPISRGGGGMTVPPYQNKDINIGPTGARGTDRGREKGGWITPIAPGRGGMTTERRHPPR